MRSHSGSRNLKILGGAALAAGVAAVVTSCGGGGGGDEDAAVATTIDTAAVTRAIDDFGGLVAVCQDGTSGAMRSTRAPGAVSKMLRLSPLLRGPTLGLPSERPQALTSTPPPDQLGDCGGRFGYRNYSHVNGVTSATLAFENYCQLDSSSGDKMTVNGGIAFVNTATPTATGPITTQLDASTSTALTTVAQSAAGATQSSETVNFTAFKMVVGVPGGVPTVANPNVISMAEMTVTNNTTGKTYRETGYALTQYQNAAGNAEWTMSGRGYRSGGSYFDIATTMPIVESASGDVLSGQIKFSGASGSNAVATVVPGSTLQVKVTVNGTPMSSVPACTTR